MTTNVIKRTEIRVLRAALLTALVWAGSASSQGADAPRIVSTTPATGATEVDPALTEITVTFDCDMDGGMSWTGGGPEFPGAQGKRPHWDTEHKTCALPVELKPNSSYRLGLNSPSYKGFQSVGGVPLVPVVYSFKTGEK